MSTKAGTLGVSARPARFTLWTAAVSALAATALIMSAVALTVAIRGDGSVSVADSATRATASIGAPLWDAGKLEAMQGRVLAGTVRIERFGPLWDAGKLEAMQGRALAETGRAEGSAPLWDAGKLEAMQGRVLAETGRAEGSAPLWDAGKLEAMQGRALAG
jgi:hypothetical protein